jgi:hypothetical protein
MLRIKNIAAAGAFARWAEMWAEAKQMRLLLERCARRMMKSQLIGAFGRWEEMWIEAKEMRHKVGIAVRRMMNRVLSAAFVHWTTCVESIANMAGRDAEMQARAALETPLSATR